MSGPEPQRFAAAERCADALIERLGGCLRLALPLGLGKPVLLVNALYQRARQRPEISLEIFTALSLAAPAPGSDLEARLLGPLLERLYGRVPALDYVTDQRRGRLPGNVRLQEFYVRPGAALGIASAQQGYVSSNYSHAARDLAARGINVIAHMVAPASGADGGRRYSLSSNPDLTADLMAALAAAGAPAPLLVGEANPALPYMPGAAAELAAEQFDLLLEGPDVDYDLFPVPNRPVGLTEHAIGLRAAALVPDGGTLQIGIGSLGDALVAALILRRRDNPRFRALLGALGAAAPGLELDPLTAGLYGCSEMFVEGFLALRDQGVLRRTVDDGVFLHAGFFLGSAAFYQRLRALDGAERDGIRMSRISFTNQLFGDEADKRRQRRGGRFVNTAMMMTLLGAAVSDALADGRVVSGVGGQYDFVAMAHALADGRSVLALPATRTSNGRVSSNIVWNYGHVTVPRHLRDLVVTEYGVADLRGRSDQDVIVAMLNLADSRFQERLRRQAVAAGKLPRRYRIPDRFRNNTPDALRLALERAGGRGALPWYPLGTDFTDTEAELAVAMAALSDSRGSVRALARLLRAGRRTGAAPRLGPALERLGLARPRGLRQRGYRALVAAALRRELYDAGRPLFAGSDRPQGDVGPPIEAEVQCASPEATETNVSTADTSADTDSLEQIAATADYGSISHLPIWENIEPGRVEDGLNALLAATEAAFDDLEAKLQSTWDGLMLPLEALQDRLGRVFGAVMHLTSVKYSDELQAAYDAVRPRYVALGSRISQSVPVYQGMVALRENAGGELDQAQRRIVDEAIRIMERSGVHLQGAARQRYQEIQERLSELGNRFQTNLVKEEKTARVRVDDRQRLRGVPAPVLAMALQTALDDGVSDADGERGPWHFAVNGVNYMAVVEHADDRALREQFYRAFRARGCADGLDNRPVVEEMLRLRQEQSALVGFASYAERSIDAKMAASVDAVWALIDELEAAARPAAEREFATLEAFARDHGDGSLAGLEPWDVAYYAEKLREAEYAYDSERLRDYFQMPRVMEGLFALIRDLYGVDIRRVDAGQVPVWDDSVDFYEVTRDGVVIAGFYVDPYARPGEKRDGAWMNTVVDRSRVLAGAERTSSLPVALFVMNARPPEANRPALMSLEEVRTLFHEFGHATQHMFTEVEEGGASGMNLVEWDAVELASQFNEYWMDHKSFLRGLTAHVETGEPLDDETLDRIIASRNFLVGIGTLRQLQFARTDLALHQHYGIAGSDDARTPFDIEREIAARTLVTPRLPDESQLPSFGHLFAGGYAAGYYSYKWAEVLAADAFAAFKEAGLDDPQALRGVAERFRETVLGLGGSLPAAEVYRRFRGRDATPDALLVEQGLR